MSPAPIRLRSREQQPELRIVPLLSISSSKTSGRRISRRFRRSRGTGIRLSLEAQTILLWIKIIHAYSFSPHTFAMRPIICVIPGVCGNNAEGLYLLRRRNLLNIRRSEVVEDKIECSSMIRNSGCCSLDRKRIGARRDVCSRGICDGQI